MVVLRRVALIVVLTSVVLSVSAAVSTTNGDKTELVLRVSCKTDGVPSDDGSLTFVLWDEQFNILQRVINLRENASFAPLTFSTEGQFIYYVSQEGGGDLAIIYDSSFYQIIVLVEEKNGVLAAWVAAVNQVIGDPMGEPEILESFAPGWVPAFENSTRQTSVQFPAADVPQTGGGMELWLVTALISGAGLILMCIHRKTPDME